MDAIIIRVEDESVLYCAASIICNLKFVRRIYIIEEKHEVGFWKKLGRLVPMNEVRINSVRPEDLCYTEIAKEIMLFYGNIVVLNPLSKDLFYKDGKSTCFVNIIRQWNFIFWGKSIILPVDIPIAVGKQILKIQCKLGVYDKLINAHYQNAQQNPENYVINSKETLIEIMPSDDNSLWQCIETINKGIVNFCRISKLESFTKDQRLAINDWMEGKIRPQISTCPESAD